MPRVPSYHPEEMGVQKPHLEIVRIILPVRVRMVTPMSIGPFQNRILPSPSPEEQEVGFDDFAATKRSVSKIAVVPSCDRKPGEQVHYAGQQSRSPIEIAPQVDNPCDPERMKNTKPNDIHPIISAHQSSFLDPELIHHSKFKGGRRI